VSPGAEAPVPLSFTQFAPVRGHTRRQILARIDLPSNKPQLFYTYDITDAETVDTGSIAGEFFFQYLPESSPLNLTVIHDSCIP
jgi:hypothetical protein